MESVLAIVSLWLVLSAGWQAGPPYVRIVDVERVAVRVAFVAVDLDVDVRGVMIEVKPADDSEN